MITRDLISPTRRARLRSTLDCTFLIADSATIIQSFRAEKNFTGSPKKAGLEIETHVAVVYTLDAPQVTDRCALYTATGRECLLWLQVNRSTILLRHWNRALSQDWRIFRGQEASPR